MIAKSYIFKNLKTINYLFNRATTLQKNLFYSKLALLELCGWIEESMDDIINRCAKKYIKNSDNFKYVENEVIKKNYGFEYQKHFRQMLIKILGLINIERIERKFDPIKFQLLESTLRILKDCRDNEAHTHLKGVTRRLDSPSVTINRFHIVYKGLKNIDNIIRNSKIKI